MGQGDERCSWVYIGNNSHDVFLMRQGVAIWNTRNRLHTIMIGALEGKIVRIRIDRCWLHVGGVSYIVCIGSTLARHLTLYQNLFLWVATTVHDGQTFYFGFQTEEEERWFHQLIAVSGVGGKVAMAILSSLNPANLASAIIKEETLALRAIDGVGPKLVARLLTELKTFANKWTVDSSLLGDEHPFASRAQAALPHEVGALQPISSHQDAVQALVALGYRRHEIDRALSNLWAQENPSEVSSWSAQMVVTKALVYLTSASNHS